MDTRSIVTLRGFFLSAALYLLLSLTASLVLFAFPVSAALFFKIIAVILTAALIICLLAAYFWILGQTGSISPVQALRRSAEFIALAAVFLTAISVLVALLCVLVYYSIQNLFTPTAIKIIIDILIAVSLVAVLPFVLNGLAVFATSAQDLKGRLFSCLRIGAKRYGALLGFAAVFALILLAVTGIATLTGAGLLFRILSTLILAVAFGALLPATFWIASRLTPAPPKPKDQIPVVLPEGGQLS